MVGHVQENLTSIMCDNQECIALTKNPTHYCLTKDIDVQHHIIRDKLENKKICLKYYPMKDMISDVLTQPLPNNRHQTLTRAMGFEAFNNLQIGNVEGRTLDCL
jgi:hypothetical protein